MRNATVRRPLISGRGWPGGTLSAVATATILASLAAAHPAGHPSGHGTGPDADQASTRAAAAAPTNEASWVVEPGWCRLPDDRPLGNTHGGIVIGPDGHVYYNTDTDRAIMVHRADGTFVRTIAPDLPAIHAMQLVVEPTADGDREAFIYAAHLGGRRIVKIDLDGRLQWSMGIPSESGHYDDGKGFAPTGIAVAPDGSIYVADGYGRNWIHRYDRDRNFIGSFGGPGTEPGQFRTCHGLTVDPRGDQPTLLICDRENRRIQRFALDGSFIEIVAEGLRRPCGISIHGEWAAVAELEGRVTVLGPDFEPVAHLGDNPDRSHWANNGVPPSAWTEGVFTAPHGVCFDDAGNLYVMDWNSTGRMSKFLLAGAVTAAPETEGTPAP